MCTVSWRRDPAGYDLFFNRDERHSRAPELPPRPDRRAGVAFVAPGDGDHGGTWLLANEFGLTVCLLNDYGNTWRPAAGPANHSRGHVVLACASAHDPAEANAHVREQPLTRTLPFRLLALSPDGEARLLHWNGVDLVPHGGPVLSPPLSSSSYATDEVVSARLERFGRYVRPSGRAGAGDFAAYHRQHQPEAGAHSVLMHRTDAATRSISHVSVRAERVRLGYEAVHWTPAGPTLSPAVTAELARRPVPVPAT